MQIDSRINSLVEIGSGYGTFTIPAAKLIKGKLFAFDIEEGMIEILNEKLSSNNIENVIVEKRDVLTQTTGLDINSVDYVMMFNILRRNYELSVGTTKPLSIY